ncbi:hypothetical protein PMAYCL1PPCAC_24207 [Pristionchus mayeri]|uniref:Uncharacterized protein n=1 Tax=Pristionchus mayeri TaxID=1317129 RepID=A0AAN5I693_9BILA|nr:hypothetical protein PMAYCL1PPCAC_24207 [Pristionchus mayeri]
MVIGKGKEGGSHPLSKLLFLLSLAILLLSSETALAVVVSFPLANQGWPNSQRERCDHHPYLNLVIYADSAHFDHSHITSAERSEGSLPPSGNHSSPFETMATHYTLGLFILLQISLSTAYPFVVYNIDDEDSSSLRSKRSFDRLEQSDFGLAKRSIPLKRAFDRLDFGDFSMRRKRAFDRLDFSDFSMRRKRAFDRLDFSDFSMRKKRAFDRIEESDFGLYKRSVAPLPLTTAVENIHDLDEGSRSALVQQLADSIRTLRRVRESEKNEEEKQ